MTFLERLVAEAVAEGELADVDPRQLAYEIEIARSHLGDAGAPAQAGGGLRPRPPRRPRPPAGPPRPSQPGGQKSYYRGIDRCTDTPSRSRSISTTSIRWASSTTRSTPSSWSARSPRTGRVAAIRSTAGDPPPPTCSTPSASSRSPTARRSVAPVEVAVHFWLDRVRRDQRRVRLPGAVARRRHRARRGHAGSRSPLDPKTMRAHTVDPGRPRGRRVAGSGPVAAKNSRSEGGTLGLEHPGVDLGRWFSRRSRTTSHSDHARRSSAPRRRRPAVDTRASTSAPGAHRARLQGHHQRAAVKPPGAGAARRPGATRGSRRARSGRRWPPARCGRGELVAVGVVDHGADRHVLRERRTRDVEGARRIHSSCDAPTGRSRLAQLFDLVAAAERLADLGGDVGGQHALVRAELSSRCAETPRSASRSASPTGSASGSTAGLSLVVCRCRHRSTVTSSISSAGASMSPSSSVPSLDSSAKAESEPNTRRSSPSSRRRITR